MTVLTVKPLILKNVDLLLGAGTPDDFGAHVSGVTFTPTSASVTWTGLKGNTYTDVSTATWVVGLDYVQDGESAASLSRYLYEHEGEHIPVSFTPLDGGPAFTGVVIVTPGAIGGQVNAASTASVQLGLESRPVLVPAV
jgi:hypothetical protein